MAEIVNELLDDALNDAEHVTEQVDDHDGELLGDCVKVPDGVKDGLQLGGCVPLNEDDSVTEGLDVYVDELVEVRENVREGEVEDECDKVGLDEAVPDGLAVVSVTENVEDAEMLDDAEAV